MRSLLRSFALPSTPSNTALRPRGRSPIASLALALATFLGATGRAEAQVCQPDLGNGGPGDLALSICGDPLDDPTNTATLLVTAAAPGAPVFVVAGFAASPTPIAGGTLVPVPWTELLTFTAGPNGGVGLPVSGVDGPPTELFVQAVAFDPNTLALEFSNAIGARFGDWPLVVEDFEGPDGGPWPAPWFAPAPFELQGAVLDAGRGRIDGWTAHVGRMALPGFAATDVDVTITIEFEDVDAQGIGVYARQNGGSLQDTAVHGQGYAVFVQGGHPGQPFEIGLWREVDGVESKFESVFDPLGGAEASGVRYCVRFQVEQFDAATTALRAKLWPEGAPEPALWTIEDFESTPVLQNVAGSFALDLYDYSGTASAWFDDLMVVEL